MTAPMSRFATLREVSNIPDFKDRVQNRLPMPITAETRTSGSLSARLSTGRSSTTSTTDRSSRSSSAHNQQSNPNSPHADQEHAETASYCSDIAADIFEMFLEREQLMERNVNFLQHQNEVSEKMRTILVDWLVDVHLKFKLHQETFFLAIDILDRYLSQVRVQRAQLQLVGVTALLLAAKYEEIWPPEVKDCIHISANTYSRDEILRIERHICSVLQFRFTTPTPFPFLARVLQTSEADDATRHAAFFFMEHAMLDAQNQQFLPSQLAYSSMYLANLLLGKEDPWNYTLQYYSRNRFADFQDCATRLMEFTNSIGDTKYQAIKRKYSSTSRSEISRLPLPTELVFPTL